MDDARRLRALAEYGVLDTPPEPPFDNLVRIAARIFRTPIALVSFVAEERQWFKARVGLDARETPRSWSFCDHAVRAGSTLVVPDATRDPRFVANPLVTGAPGIRFYSGAPLRTADGHGLGTLCVIDRQPRDFGQADRELLEALAAQVELELELHRRVAMLEQALGQKQGEQRSIELFTAMVVHDLRNPVAAIGSLAASATAADDESRRDLEGILAEARRMRHMLADVLDLSLHRLGQLSPRRSAFEVGPLLDEVARRMSLVRPPGAIPATGRVEQPLRVDADRELVVRVLENLLGNAWQHGGAVPEAAVEARPGAPGRVVVEVRDHGPVIPEAEREVIFDPGVRSASAAHPGYGLGLAFCRIAVEAHGGRITVQPNPGGAGNCFSFDLPAASPDRGVR